MVTKPNNPSYGNNVAAGLIIGSVLSNATRKTDAEKEKDLKKEEDLKKINTLNNRPTIPPPPDNRPDSQKIRHIILGFLYGVPSGIIFLLLIALFEGMELPFKANNLNISILVSIILVCYISAIICTFTIPNTKAPTHPPITIIPPQIQNINAEPFEYYQNMNHYEKNYQTQYNNLYY